MMPAIMAWLLPGAAWFHNQLIPDGTPVPAALSDARTTMAIWQLGNCTHLPHAQTDSQYLIFTVEKATCF